MQAGLDPGCWKGLVQKKKFMALVLGDAARCCLRVLFSCSFTGVFREILRQIKARRLCQHALRAGAWPQHGARLAPSGGIPASPGVPAPSSELVWMLPERCCTACRGCGWLCSDAVNELTGASSLPSAALANGTALRGLEEPSEASPNVPGLTCCSFGTELAGAQL